MFVKKQLTLGTDTSIPPSIRLNTTSTNVGSIHARICRKNVDVPGTFDSAGYSIILTTIQSCDFCRTYIDNVLVEGEVILRHNDLVSLGCCLDESDETTPSFLVMMREDDDGGTHPYPQIFHEFYSCPDITSRYWIFKPLASGSFSVVYLVENKETEEFSAIKCVNRCKINGMIANGMIRETQYEDEISVCVIFSYTTYSWRFDCDTQTSCRY